jgi:hypothetical protein
MRNSGRLLSEKKREALHDYPVRKRVAAATATSRRIENLREAFCGKKTLV